MAEIKFIKGGKEPPGVVFDKIAEELLRSCGAPKPIVPDFDKMRLVTTADVVAQLKALKATVIEGSRQANRLAGVIKDLTWVLVGLTAAAVILAGISLFVIFGSTK